MSALQRRLGVLAAWLLLAVLVWGAIAWAGRSSAREAEARVRAEMRDSVAFVAARAYREKRAVLDSARREFDAAERRRVQERANSEQVLVDLQSKLAAPRQVLADTTSDATVLRASLGTALAAYDSLAQAFRDYLRADSASHRAIDTERAVYRESIDKADAALRSMTQARDAWKAAAECRTLFRMRCPTRTQTFVGGGLVVAAVFVTARR